jgi:catechol 2,3-dioxygenase-like lactoylglutathione lyase family enzyme
MAAAGFDHVAITVADVEATLSWYERLLGARRLHHELYLSGQMPIALLQVGANRISVHDAAAPALPGARRPTVGSQDLCFRWDGSVESALAAVEGAGLEVVLGPVERPTSDGRPGASVYTRDPDGNLVELLAPTDG